MNYRLQHRSLYRVLVLATTLLWAGMESEAFAAKASKAAEGEAAEAPRRVGLLISRFMIRDLRPAEGIRVRLSFSLYAEVDEERENEMRRLIDAKKHRIRNEVLVAIRTCEQHEFQEPGLERLRRRVLMRLRRTVPDLKAEGLLIGEFEFFNE